MGTAKRLGRRVYEPLIRRLDGLQWRVETFERHRAEDALRSRGELETAVAAGTLATREHLDARLDELHARLDELERRIEAGHASQVEGVTYLGRAMRELQVSDAEGGDGRSA
jgi:DNA-binding GntR family transcriptional regulator